jgi:hypothetical protein
MQSLQIHKQRLPSFPTSISTASPRHLHGISMNDVFHLSPADITAADLAHAASECGHTNVQIRPDAATVLNGSNGRVLWSITAVDLDDLSDEECRDLSQRGVRKVHTISYHPGEADKLRELARTLLRTHGGWIGSDDDFFTPLYDLTDIDNLLSPER